jgi:uncharacterized protein (TIRG00374 family)
MKKFFAAVILLLGILFVISRFTQLQEVTQVLLNGNVYIVLVAILVQLCWFVVQGMTFQSIFHMLGVEKRLPSLIHLVTAVNFVNMVAPSAGVSGMAVFYSDARRNGHSSARITVGSILFLIFDYIGLLSFIFIGLVIVAFQGSLDATEIIAYVLFVLLTVTLAALLFLASKSKQRLSALLCWFAGIANKLTHWILKRELVTSERIDNFATEITDGVTALRQVRSGWLRPAGLTILNKSLLVSILGLTFLAFNQPVSLDHLIAGFAIGYLFVIISPTPAGVGVVEGILTLALSNLGVDVEAAAVITLAFRGITFWLPLALGLVAFRTLPK